MTTAEEKKMKEERVRAGLRMTSKLNEETRKAAEKLGISKNDFILLAIQEKLKRDSKSRR